MKSILFIILISGAVHAADKVTEFSPSAQICLNLGDKKLKVGKTYAWTAQVNVKGKSEVQVIKQSLAEKK